MTTKIKDSNIPDAGLSSQWAAGDIKTTAATTFVGWLLCNGAAVSRTTYATLYAALGGAASPFGQGDGSTTFNVPDARGRAIIGVGTGPAYGGKPIMTARTMGDKVGEENHVITVEELAPHSHPAIYVGDTSVNNYPGFATIKPAGAGGTAAVGNTGSGTGHNTMQPSIAFNIIIKT